MELTSHLTDPDDPAIKRRSQKMLLWLGMISMVMIFAALSSAYIVSSSSEHWSSVPIPASLYLSTAAIILSSITLALATGAAARNNYGGVKFLMVATLALGLLFVYFQLSSWNWLVENGIYFAGTKNAAGSYLYFLTGLHLAHLVFGIIALIVSTIKSFGNQYDSSNMHGLNMTATFWHFLDFLWIYLFLFLLLFR